MHRRSVLSIVAAVAVAVATPVVITQSAQAAPVTVAIDRTDEAAVRDAYLNVYLPTQSVPIGWTGDVATCTAGAPSSAQMDATVTAYNYLRAMAGQAPVTVDAAITAYSQQSALTIDAERAANPTAAINVHDRQPSWPCYQTPPNLGSLGEIEGPGLGAGSLAMFLLDPGPSNQQMWHRQLVLWDHVTRIGVGITSGTTLINQNWPMTTPSAEGFGWPAAGYFPYELAKSSATRWSYYPQAGSTAGATVTVTKNGTPLAISAPYSVVSATSSTSAMGWDMPTLTAPAAGAVDTYTVSISGLTGGPTTSVSYDVKIFNAMEVDFSSVTVDGTARVGQTLTAASSVSPTDATVTYEWLRDGQPMTPDATGPTYQVRTDDIGHLIQVLATGTKSGFQTGTMPSDPTSPVVAAEPTDAPTTSPTVSPTTSPTAEPTTSPTTSPRTSATAEPTANPTDTATVESTDQPTTEPTDEPAATPTTRSMDVPTPTSTQAPTADIVSHTGGTPASTGAPAGLLAVLLAAAAVLLGRRFLPQPR